MNASRGAQDGSASPQAPSVDIDQIKALGARAGGWITAHLSCFQPDRNGKFDGAGVQSFAEGCLTYCCADGWDSSVTNALVGNGGVALWGDHLAAQVERQDFAELSIKHPATCFPLLLPYLTLRAAGRRSSCYDQAVATLRRLGLPDDAEVVPYRAFDWRYFMWRSGFDSEPAWLRSYEATFLAKCRDTLVVDNELAYAMTHTIFYLSDFGGCQVRLSSQERQRVSEIFDSLIIHYIRLGHLDLLGELLIGSVALRQENQVTDACALGLKYFWRFAEADGRVPPFARQTVEGGRAEPESGLFQSCYHTTLVAFLLAGAIVGRHAR